MSGLNAHVIVERSDGFLLDVEVRIEAGQTVALLGPNGAGKSTLVGALAGLIPLDGGRIVLNGVVLDDADADLFVVPEQRRLGIVFQDYLLFDHMSVLDNIAFGQISRGSDRATARGSAQRWIDDLELTGFEERKPPDLSGGQAQRVAVARALLTEPSLIVADEPVSMLDASLRMSIVNMFRRLKDEEQVNIVYITHDLATAFYAADRIAVMLRGWNVEMGPVEDVLGTPMHPYSRNLKDSVPLADPDKAWDEKVDLAVMDSEEYLLTGCRFAGRCSYVMDECREKAPSELQVQNRMVKCFLYDEEIVGASGVADNIEKALE